MNVSRRVALGLGAAAAAGVAGAWRLGRRSPVSIQNLLPKGEPTIARQEANMRYRRFGSTGLEVSEVGFGGWPMGGNSYGAADRDAVLAALARAEELGCNFVDTAMVYGDSEEILGQFLRGRRDKWIVATKYSEQPSGMTDTLHEQLRRLQTDRVDFYQIHWAPHEPPLYEELYRLKKSGDVRFVGVSLKTVNDIDYVINNTMIDGIQVAISLLDPSPFVLRAESIARRGLAVVARSALKEGFLAGTFQRDARFTDQNDQRSAWTPGQIAETVDRVERFRFLEKEAGSMATAAARYPLSFPGVSTVILGTRSLKHVESNFGEVPRESLSAESLRRIAEVQYEMRLAVADSPLQRLWRSLRS